MREVKKIFTFGAIKLIICSIYARRHYYIILVRVIYVYRYQFIWWKYIYFFFVPYMRACTYLYSVRMVAVICVGTVTAVAGNVIIWSRCSSDTKRFFSDSYNILSTLHYYHTRCHGPAIIIQYVPLNTLYYFVSIELFLCTVHIHAHLHVFAAP